MDDKKEEERKKKEVNPTAAQALFTKELIYLTVNC